jgi:ATP phosphoribosyltransferase regulatory subunit
MIDTPPPNPALLPAGLQDLLPPAAETEAASVNVLMSAFASHGYQRVQPPLLEFEESLLVGAGAAVSEQTFRFMDPDTQRMMGVRADMTPQLARIASTRLSSAPRPLRLSYAGPCLRVRGTQLAPDRQIMQAGIELIGPDSPQADAEIVLVAAEALSALGLPRLSFDLTWPPLMPALLESAGLTGPARLALAHALDRKDVSAVARLGGPLSNTLVTLLNASGPCAEALAALKKVKLPPQVAAMAARLGETVRAIQERAPNLRLTVDPIECRSFRYHTGLYITVYSVGRHEELGRGGRYRCGEDEPATGLTLFPDAVLRAAPRRAPAPRVFIPAGRDTLGAALRKQGYATIAALVPVADEAAEARRLLCTHILRDGVAVKLAAPGDREPDEPADRESETE